MGQQREPEALSGVLQTQDEQAAALVVQLDGDPHRLRRAWRHGKLLLRARPFPRGRAERASEGELQRPVGDASHDHGHLAAPAPQIERRLQAQREGRRHGAEGRQAVEAAGVVVVPATPAPAARMLVAEHGRPRGHCRDGRLMSRATLDLSLAVDEAQAHAPLGVAGGQQHQWDGVRPVDRLAIRRYREGRRALLRRRLLLPRREDRLPIADRGQRLAEVPVAAHRLHRLARGSHADDDEQQPRQVHTERRHCGLLNRRLSSHPAHGLSRGARDRRRPEELVCRVLVVHHGFARNRDNIGAPWRARGAPTPGCSKRDRAYGVLSQGISSASTEQMALSRFRAKPRQEARAFSSAHGPPEQGDPKRRLPLRLPGQRVVAAFARRADGVDRAPSR